MEAKYWYVILLALLGLGVIALLIFAPDIEVWRQERQYRRQLEEGRV